MSQTEVTELARIAGVLDGTTTSGPLKVIADNSTAIRTSLETIATRLTTIATVTTAMEASLDFIGGELSDLDQQAFVMNTNLDEVTAAIANLTVNVTVQDASTAAAISAQTATRPPTTDPASLKATASSRTREGRSSRRGRPT